jgi:hypothetical protein
VTTCVVLISQDRLLVMIGVVTGGQWLVPPLVDAWLVPGLLGPVLCLLVGLRLLRLALVRLPLLRAAMPALAVPRRQVSPRGSG